MSVNDVTAPAHGCDAPRPVTAGGPFADTFEQLADVIEAFVDRHAAR